MDAMGPWSSQRERVFFADEEGSDELMYRYIITHPNTTMQVIFCVTLDGSFPAQSAEEMPESPTPLLQHPRPARDLADADPELLGDFPLRGILGELPHELPSFRHGCELVGRENIFEQYRRLPLVQLQGT